MSLRYSRGWDAHHDHYLAVHLAHGIGVRLIAHLLSHRIEICVVVDFLAHGIGVRLTIYLDLAY